MVVAVVFGAALGACADAFVADAPRPTPSVEGDSAPPSRDASVNDATSNTGDAGGDASSGECDYASLVEEPNGDRRRAIRVTGLPSDEAMHDLRFFPDGRGGVFVREDPTRQLPRLGGTPRAAVGFAIDVAVQPFTEVTMAGGPTFAPPTAAESRLLALGAGGSLASATVCAVYNQAIDDTGRRSIFSCSKSRALEESTAIFEHPVNEVSVSGDGTTVLVNRRSASSVGPAGRYVSPVDRKAWARVEVASTVQELVLADTGALAVAREGAAGQPGAVTLRSLGATLGPPVTLLATTSSTPLSFSQAACALVVSDSGVLYRYQWRRK